MINKERIPAEVFPPGEFLADEIAAREWTQVEFAQIIGRPTRVVNEIIMGKKAITPETALEFAAALNTSPQYWMNLQTSYDLWKSAAVQSTEHIKRSAKLHEKFPIREMIKRGWLLASESLDVLENQVLDFFNIKSVDEEPILGHAARRNHNAVYSQAQTAWLFRVSKLASSYKVSSYSEKKLRSAIKQFESYLCDPEEIRHVPNVLADCGVKLIVVEPFPNSKIDGACFWINNNVSPVVGLSMKGDYIDRFWFNLRHELEHVLRGDGKSSAVIDEFDSHKSVEENEAEQIANAVAAEFCVPQDKLSDFIVRHDPIYAVPNFLGFSKIVKRHPGIVAGQLQHKIGRPELFKKYQVRVRDIVISTALTDGYGMSIF